MTIKIQTGSGSAVINDDQKAQIRADLGINSDGSAPTSFTELADSSTVNLPTQNAPLASALALKAETSVVNASLAGKADNSAITTLTTAVTTKATLQTGALATGSNVAPNATAVMNGIATAIGPLAPNALPTLDGTATGVPVGGDTIALAIAKLNNTRAIVLAEVTLTSGETLTRASHLNRPLKITGSVSLAMTNASASGAIGGDILLVQNEGSGTFTATGAITAPTGRKLSGGPGEEFTAYFNSTTNAWISTTLDLASFGGAPALTALSILIPNDAPNVAIVTMSRPIFGTLPAATAIVITVAGTARTSTSISLTDPSNIAVVFGGAAVTNGQTVTAAYTETSTRIVSKDTNTPLQPFSGTSVTNNVASAGSSDNFMRANGALGSTPVGGKAWSTRNSTSAVVGNQCQVDPPSDYGEAFFDSGLHDGTFEFTFDATSVSNNYPQGVFRRSDGDNLWIVEVHSAGGDAQGLKLTKRSGGGNSEVANNTTAAGSPATNGGTYHIVVTCSGSSISAAYATGGSAVATTDTFNQNATGVGFRTYTGNDRFNYIAATP